MCIHEWNGTLRSSRKSRFYFFIIAKRWLIIVFSYQKNVLISSLGELSNKEKSYKLKKESKRVWNSVSLDWFELLLQFVIPLLLSWSMKNQWELLLCGHDINECIAAFCWSFDPSSNPKWKTMSYVVRNSMRNNEIHFSS